MNLFSIEREPSITTSALESLITAHPEIDYISRDRTGGIFASYRIHDWRRQGAGSLTLGLATIDEDYLYPEVLINAQNVFRNLWGKEEQGITIMILRRKPRQTTIIDDQQTGARVLTLQEIITKANIALEIFQVWTSCSPLVQKQFAEKVRDYLPPYPETYSDEDRVTLQQYYRNHGLANRVSAPFTYEACHYLWETLRQPIVFPKKGRSVYGKISW